MEQKTHEAEEENEEREIARLNRKLTPYVPSNNGGKRTAMMGGRGRGGPKNRGTKGGTEVGRTLQGGKGADLTVGTHDKGVRDEAVLVSLHRSHHRHLLLCDGRARTGDETSLIILLRLTQPSIDVIHKYSPIVQL
jgi:hypothetical protein